MQLRGAAWQRRACALTAAAARAQRHECRPRAGRPPQARPPGQRRGRSDRLQAPCRPPEARPARCCRARHPRRTPCKQLGQQEKSQVAQATVCRTLGRMRQAPKPHPHAHAPVDAADLRAQHDCLEELPALRQITRHLGARPQRPAHAEQAHRRGAGAHQRRVRGQRRRLRLLLLLLGAVRAQAQGKIDWEEHVCQEERSKPAMRACVGGWAGSERGVCAHSCLER